MNRRGDIPITILVIGILAICGLTILSFYLANRSMEKGFDSINLINQAVILKEKIYFYEHLGFDDGKIKELLGIEDGINLRDDFIWIKYPLG